MHPTVGEAIQNLIAIEPELEPEPELENVNEKDTPTIQINASESFQQSILMGGREQNRNT